MRYESTTGLSEDLTDELVRRLEEILECRPPATHLPRVLPLRELVEVVLVVVRQNVSQALMADLYGVSQPTVSRAVRALLPLIDEALAVHEPEVHSVFRNRVVLVDGTDVPTGNRRSGRENYSGKRHRQGLNVQVAAAVDGTLLAVSAPVPGCRHDRRALAEVGWEEILDRYQWWADPGYQGTSAVSPTKRTATRELAGLEKATNRMISSVRSAVERCISHLKNWKILATGYRYRLAELPAFISIVSRLEFFRLGW